MDAFVGGIVCGESLVEDDLHAGDMRRFGEDGDRGIVAGRIAVISVAVMDYFGGELPGSFNCESKERFCCRMVIAREAD